ncbi:rCG33418 [Rattus norvegicus]|uniref:RCG33418 n=1 Tax=Rattus norvegicus TaxID=10116 RepID=A6HGX9_RAT|nr:rCG33418 [Rattus norvegicus]
MRLSKDSSRWQFPTSIPCGSLPKGNDWLQIASFLNDDSRQALPQGSLAESVEKSSWPLWWPANVKRTKMPWERKCQESCV